MLLLGLAGLAIFVVALVFLFQAFEIGWLLAAIFGGIDIFLVFVYCSRIVHSILKVERVPAYSEAEFNDDHVVLRVYKNGELASETKIFYRLISFYRLTPHYVVAVISKSEFFPCQRNEEILGLLNSKGIKKK